MGDPYSLRLRLPPNVKDLRILNMGAGYCSSPISNQIPFLECRELINIEIWPGAFAKLQHIEFAAGIVHNELGDMCSYALTHFEQDIFDVVLFIDTLEHIAKEHALEILRHCRVIGKEVVIFVPIGECKQDALDGNPYQSHLSTWNVGDFEGAYVEYLQQFHKHFSPPVDAAWVTYGSQTF